MKYCWAFGLSRPYWCRMAALNCGVHDWQRSPETASPGTTRKRKKLSVIATSTVTSAYRVRLMTKSALLTGGPRTWRSARVRARVVALAVRPEVGVEAGPLARVGRQQARVDELDVGALLCQV